MCEVLSGRYAGVRARVRCVTTRIPSKMGTPNTKTGRATETVAAILKVPMIEMAASVKPKNCAPTVPMMMDDGCLL